MRLVADQSERLDRFLARSVPSMSRTRLARLIADRLVIVDGDFEKPAFRLEPGMEVEFDPPGETPPHDLAPFPLALDIIYEDTELIVVNKPRGLATHPAPTLSEPSLVNALLAHGANLSSGSAPFRPGIVHRLDKDTTGLLVVAKTDAGHARLAAQIAAKSVSRCYLAVVAGAPASERFDVDAPIGRDPRNRLRMAVDPKGRASLTHVLALRHFADRTLLAVRLSTGRTHQIRVHLSAVGLPVVGDRVYGGGSGPLQLHAAALTFAHPSSGIPLTFTCNPPEDFSIDPLENEMDRVVGLS
ncbi:MAG: RluA family pseudouridine synthase [Fimbriimonadaceae bacterium]